MKQYIITISILLLLTTTSHAQWVDDWLEQRTSTTPNYFSGQQRGYYSGGSFNTRWQNSVSYPITVEPPRIKSGCGGIDLFMGGFSFMNTDYLVDKLQGILSGAAAVAFDLGLKTLCEQCSNSIKNLEAISDKLNSMQLDECAAAKELVGVVMDENGFYSSEVMKERLGTAIKENKLSQGVSEMWDIITTEERANNNVPLPADISRITNGCNADIKATFLSGGSLLDSVGSRMGTPADYNALIRGLIGDVQLEGASAAYKISYIPPCSENNPDDLKSFTNGEIYAKEISGNCHQISDGNRDLRQYILTTLTSIADKIETKGTLTTPEQDFLSSTPLAILPILKTAVGIGAKETTTSTLAEITANAYAVQMLSDLYVRAETVAMKAQEMLEKKAEAGSGQPSENCAAVVFAEHAAQDISIMLKHIRRLQDAARNSYIASAKEMATIMEYLERMQKIEIQMKEELTRRYGKNIASRLR